MNSLKMWRMERGLTQIQLSHISHVPRHVIQMAEIDLHVPEEEYQQKLSASLGVSMTDLFPKKKLDASTAVQQADAEEI